MSFARELGRLDTTVILFYLAMFAIVVPVIALIKQSSFEKQILEMKRELWQLRMEVSRLGSVGTAPRSEPSVQESPVSQAAVVEPPGVPQQVQRPVYTPPQPPRQPQVHMPPRIPQPFNHVDEQAEPVANSRTREEWEMLIGGNLLLKIGAVALLIGIAYLMQVLSRGEIIPPVLRVVLGFMAGGAFLGLGNYFHKRGAQVFAQGLMGAGIGILYISSYVSFKSYQLVPQAAAIFLMSAVTSVAIVEALRYDSLVVSLLGLFGGFLTPALIGGDGGAGGAGGNWLGLFIYLSLLNISLLAIAVKKDDWVSIEPLALIGTWITFFVWHERYYNESLFGLSLAFGVVFWALFYAVDVYRTARKVDTYSGLRSVVAVANSAALYSALYMDINHHYPGVMGLVAFVLAVVYLVTVLGLLKVRQGGGTFVARNLVTSIAFMAIATWIQFSDKPMLMVTLWSLEALGLVVVGIRWQLRSVIISALALFVYTAVSLLGNLLDGSDQSVSSFVPVLNMRFMAYGTLALSMCLSTVLFSRSDIEERGQVNNILDIGWTALLFILFTMEINDCFWLYGSRNPQAASNMQLSTIRGLAMGVAWMLYSLALAWPGLNRQRQTLTYMGLISLGLGTILVAANGCHYAPVQGFAPFINIRAAAFTAAVVIIAVHRRMLSSRVQDNQFLASLPTLYRVGASLLLFELVSMETWDYFSKAQGSGQSVDLRQTALSLAWLGYSVVLMCYGIWRRTRVLRFVSLGIYLVAIAKVFLYDLKSLEVLYRTFSFIGLGLILIATSYLYQRFRSVIEGEEPEHAQA